MTNWVERLTGQTQARLLSLLRRSHRTISGLAEALGLTDNAVRTHIAALSRDGIVEDVGTQRDTGGKPARVYGITREGEELFPKAYATVLEELVKEIIRTDGAERAAELLRSVGRRAASRAPTDDPEQRAAAAVDGLRNLGGDVELQPTSNGWRIQGYGCPLSAVTSHGSELCGLVQALVEEVTGQPVTECCERSGRPRCAFEISATPAPGH